MQPIKKSGPGESRQILMVTFSASLISLTCRVLQFAAAFSADDMKRVLISICGKSPLSEKYLPEPQSWVW